MVLLKVNILDYFIEQSLKIKIEKSDNWLSYSSTVEKSKTDEVQPLKS